MTSGHDARVETGAYPIGLRLSVAQDRTLRRWPLARIRPKSVALGVRSLFAEVDVLRSQLAASEAARARLVEAGEHVAEAARVLLWSAQGVYGNRWHAAADSEAGLEDAIGRLRALAVAAGQGGAGEGGTDAS